MATQKLHKLLDHLHQEVDALDHSSSAEKARLDSLIEEIEMVLDKDEPEQHSSLVNSMRAKLIDFESDHPTTSGVIQRLMQSLSDMGI